MRRLHLFRDAQQEPDLGEIGSDALISGPVGTRTLNVFESSDGKMFGGIWRATVGSWRVSYTETEYCYITQGRARLIDNAQEVVDVCIGDGFIIESGFEGVWEVLEDMEEHYMIVLPQS